MTGVEILRVGLDDMVTVCMSERGVEPGEGPMYISRRNGVSDCLSTHLGVEGER